MSRQLQISSLFSALALVSLCMVAAVNDLRAGDVSVSQDLVSAQTIQAEIAPGLHG